MSARLDVPMVIDLEVYPTPPKQATGGSGGVDLRSSESVWIPSGRIVAVDLGVRVAIPAGHVGILAIRSSLAKRGASLANGIGVIDSDYRGPVKALMQVDGGKLRVDKGQRIAQLMVMPCPRVFVRVVDTLDDTERGAGGFGSTDGVDR